jgi:hypothetical protein
METMETVVGTAALHNTDSTVEGSRLHSNSRSREDQRNGDVATVGFIPLETSGAGSFWDICGLYWHKKRSFPTPPLNLPADRHAPLTGYKI